MNRIKRRGGILSFLMLVYLNSLTVFADSGNAVVDILNDGRFNGAMSSIQWLTKMVDNWFIQIITIVAFFVISMSLLKNALAAAYCAFPVFFDKVHEAHVNNQGFKLADIKSVGSTVANKPISDIIYGALPDFKAMTDFVDTDISPKQYFLKAVPQMCIMVILGIFIYNGYYRDVSATVGQAGASIVSNLLGSVDPEAMVNSVFNTTSQPANIFENDASLEGGYAYTISTEVYKTIIARTELIRDSQEQKDALMRDCEKFALDFVRGEGPGYNFTEEDISNVNSQIAGAVNDLEGNQATGSESVADPAGSQIGDTIFKCADPIYSFQLTGFSVRTVSESNMTPSSLSLGNNGAIQFTSVVKVVNIAQSLDTEFQDRAQNTAVVVAGTLTPVIADKAQAYATTAQAQASAQSSSIDVGVTAIYVGSEYAGMIKQENEMCALTQTVLNTAVTANLSNLKEGVALASSSFTYSGYAAGGDFKFQSSTAGARIGYVSVSFDANGTTITKKLPIYVDTSKSTSDLMATGN